MTSYIELNIEDIQPNLRAVNLYQCGNGFETGDRKLYDYYFLYVHRGKGVIKIGDNKYDAVSGDLFFCSPGVLNSISADDDDPFLLTGINFDFTNHFRNDRVMYPIQAELFNTSWVTEYVEFNDFDGFPEKIGLPDCTQVRTMIYDMVNGFNMQKKYYSTYINGILQSFIILVSQYIIQNGFGITNIQRGNEIIKYLSDNFMQNFTGKDIAGVFHYHPDHINRIVCAYTGMTLKQFVIDLRIREALNLLMQSNLDIGSIAYKVGYDNVQYFSRIFKKKTGYPPGYFRRKVI